MMRKTANGLPFQQKRDYSISSRPNMHRRLEMLVRITDDTIKAAEKMGEFDLVELLCEAKHRLRSAVESLDWKKKDSTVRVYQREAA